MKKKSLPNQEELKRLYLKEKESSIKIAELYRVHSSQILRLLRRYGIRIRSRQESIKLSPRGREIEIPSELDLRDLYIHKKESLERIAKSHGASVCTVLRWMEFYNIERRALTESLNLRYEREGKIKPSMGELKQKYNETSSLKLTGDYYGVSPTTVVRWLDDDKIKRKRKLGPVWRDLEFTLNYAREFLKQNPKYTTLPGKGMLAKLNEGSLGVSIVNYHGGFIKFRRLLGEPEIIKYNSQLDSFLSQNPEAKAISSLAGENGYSTDVAEILYKMWPGRFPSASDLARSLPGAIKRIGHSLHPFTMDKARGLYEETKSLPQEIKCSLDNILYSMAVEQYQVPFNRSPEKTIKDLSTLTKEKNGVGNLARDVLNYYTEIYNFNIPGFGSIGSNK